MEIKLSNGRLIGDGHPAYIIAEAGINHNGSMEIAKKLIEKAAANEADAIKFQKRTLDEMYVKSFLDEPYLKPYSFGRTYGEHKAKLEFSDEQFFELHEYARSRNIEFLVSGFDAPGFEFIDRELKVPLHKIPSPYVNHYPLLKQVAQYGKPMILSTGMHTLEEVAEAVKFIKQYNDQIVVLQCTTMYPCLDEQVNLKVMQTYREKMDVLVGYSSHDRGIILPVASVALGGCVIEKHYTLDRTMVGPDHAASVEPRGLDLIVHYTRTVEKGMGDGIKELFAEEKAARIKYGVSVVSKGDIEAGTVITEDMLTSKVPGGGIFPKHIDQIVGKKAKTNIPHDTILTEEDFE